MIMDTFHNKRSPRRAKITYIVVHDTGNSGIGANAMAHVRYFQSSDRQASADYVVDDSQAIQLNPSILTTCSWHCGDGPQPYQERKITNHNSIGVEMCRNIDGDWEKTKNNTMDLVIRLMQDYNIPVSHVVRHYDASGKLCPAKMADNNWAEWREWWATLANTYQPMDRITIITNGSPREYNAILRHGHYYVPVRELAEEQGYHVHWDSVAKNIILTPSRARES